MEGRTGAPANEDSLCTDVHTLISCEALLRPTSDGHALSRQLQVLALIIK